MAHFRGGKKSLGSLQIATLVAGWDLRGGHQSRLEKPVRLRQGSISTVDAGGGRGDRR